MPKCELCGATVKLLFTRRYSNDEHLNICPSCLSEGELKEDAEYESQKDYYIDNPEHERC